MLGHGPGSSGLIGPALPRPTSRSHKSAVSDPITAHIGSRAGAIVTTCLQVPACLESAEALTRGLQGTRLLSRIGLISPLAVVWRDLPIYR